MNRVHCPNRRPGPCCLRSEGGFLHRFRFVLDSRAASKYHTHPSPMKVRFPLLVCAVLALLLAASFLHANVAALGLAGRRAATVEDKRVEKQMWAQPQSSSMMNKRFPIEHWDKHFSSVGSKRAPISLQEGKEKAIFRTKTLDRTAINFEMSRWNERMADLHKKAGIEVEDQAQLVADRQLYNMMLQDTRQFKELGGELSLRDLNRYQFRRNRSDAEIPVEQAGSSR